ncbi:MAG: hypothetical protein IKV21_06515 [Clostridia bacterium]|nr:hypothetical protein [Clostridia bacterium]
MKKNFKKVIALLLSVLMLMSVMAVGVSAEDAASGEPEGTEEHRGFIQIFIDFFKEFVGFFRYIFYDVFRGEPVE